MVNNCIHIDMLTVILPSYVSELFLMWQFLRIKTRVQGKKFSKYTVIVVMQLQYLQALSKQSIVRGKDGPKQRKKSV